MTRHKIVCICALLLIGRFAHSTAQAVVYLFQPITNNNPVNVAIGAAQLSLDVTSPNASQVLFTFGNQGPGASVIEQVFFEQGVLASLASVTNGPGVLFSADASPGTLPGGNTVSFTEAFSASANPPAPTNGVNNTLAGTEFVSVLFNLTGGNTFADVTTGLGNSSFRVGVHVTAYAAGGSESYINQTQPIPDPATMMLLLAGAGYLGLRRVHGS